MWFLVAALFRVIGLSNDSGRSEGVLPFWDLERKYGLYWTWGFVPVVGLSSFDVAFLPAEAARGEGCWTVLLACSAGSSDGVEEFFPRVEEGLDKSNARGGNSTRLLVSRVVIELPRDMDEPSERRRKFSSSLWCWSWMRFLYEGRMTEGEFRSSQGRENARLIQGGKSTRFSVQVRVFVMIRYIWTNIVQWGIIFLSCHLASWESLYRGVGLIGFLSHGFYGELGWSSIRGTRIDPF
jgi:hypothetical protein